MSNLFNLLKRNRHLSFLCNLLIVLISFFISLVLGEIFLILFWNPVPKLVETGSVQGLALPSYPDFVSFTARQSTYVTSRTCEFTNLYKINSLGMRDREHLLDKLSNKKKVLCIGDSFTEGVGVELEKTYPYLLQEMSQGKIECFNAGIRSTCPSHAYFRIQKFLEAGIKPDAVVIQLFSNDFNDDQIHTKQYNLRVIEGELVRDPFHKSAGGTLTRIMGPAAFPLYKTHLFLLLLSLFHSSPVLEPFSVSFDAGTAETVLEIFSRSQVEGIHKVQKNDQTTLQFPLLPSRTLSKDDLNQLWCLLGAQRLNKLNLNISNSIKEAQELNDSAVQQSLLYLDCTLGLLEKSNIPLIVYYAPCASDSSNKKAEIFFQWCANNNIPFVFPLKEVVQFSQETSLPVFYPFDGHMTEEGHQVVASVLLDTVKPLL